MTRGIYHRRWTSVRAVISRNDGLGRLIFPPFAHRTGFARPAKLSFPIIRRKFLRYRLRADKSVRTSTRFVKTLTNVFADIEISKYLKCLHSSPGESRLFAETARGVHDEMCAKIRCFVRKILTAYVENFLFAHTVTSRTAGWGSEESRSSPISQTIQGRGEVSGVLILDRLTYLRRPTTLSRATSYSMHVSWIIDIDRGIDIIPLNHFRMVSRARDCTVSS